MASPLTQLARCAPVQQTLSLPNERTGCGSTYVHNSMPCSYSYPAYSATTTTFDSRVDMSAGSCNGLDASGNRPKKPHPSAIKVTGEMAAIEEFLRESTQEDVARRLLALEQMVLRKRTAHLTEKNLLLAALSRYKSKVAALVRELEGGGAVPDWGQRYRAQF